MDDIEIKINGRCVYLTDEPMELIGYTTTVYGLDHYQVLHNFAQIPFLYLPLFMAEYPGIYAQFKDELHVCTILVDERTGERLTYSRGKQKLRFVACTDKLDDALWKSHLRQSIRRLYNL